jgi:fermentation-respiration switch protein FrsA (DUF1100 family)
MCGSLSSRAETLVLKLIVVIVLAAYIAARLVFIFKKRGIKAMLISIAVLLIGGYIGLGAFLYFMQPKLVYYPLGDIPATPLELRLPYEDVFFLTADSVELTGWYVPAAKPGSLTVLFCHGNGGNIGYYLDTIGILHEMGVNSFIFDYRGYGRSDGTPSEEGMYVDAYAAYQWLVRQKHCEPNTIVVFGRSLGGSVAAQLASKLTVRGLWLESAFTSYADMAAYHYPYFPVRRLCRYTYDTLAYLKNVRCPVIVIHSPDDEIVPFEMGRRLYEAAGEPKKFVQISGSHNEGFVESGSQYTAPIAAWLERLNSKESKAIAP